jgi:hypothetical protein
VKSLILAIIILAVGAVAVGASYQALGTWLDARRFPQRGKPVQVGQLNLNIDCSGDREGPESPLVILDSGMGVPAVGWMTVQPEVAKFTRVCSYDRAGYGWSDAGRNPAPASRSPKN